MAPTYSCSGNLASTQALGLQFHEELSPALLDNRFLILPSRCLCYKPGGAAASHLPTMFQFLQKGSGTPVEMELARRRGSILLTNTANEAKSNTVPRSYFPEM